MTLQPPPQQLSEALTEWRREILGYLVEMQGFNELEPNEIIPRIAAFSSRATYIRMLVVRSSKEAARTFRTQEIDPFIAECDRQFKAWSRVGSLHQAEWEMAGR